MTQPTAGETAFARRVGLQPDHVAFAREVLNSIAALPWPEPVRLALLVRLARGIPADVGEVLGKQALGKTPLESFDQLLPVSGLADKRVAGLARALADVDATVFISDAAALKVAEEKLRVLAAENEAQRVELDALRHRVAAGPSGSGVTSGQMMMLHEAALSISSQLKVADDALRAHKGGSLQLEAMQVQLRAAAVTSDSELAFDFAPEAQASSALTLAFAARERSRPSAWPDVRVPDVRGYSPALARRKLQALGLAAQLASTSAVSQGTVVKQVPAPDTSVQPGTQVRLVLA